MKSTEGATWQDPRFEENYEQANSAGLALGAYHFFTFCTDGKSQAENFLEALDGKKLDLPPAVDIEPGGNCTQDVPTASVIQNAVAEFVNIVREETGQEPILYILERNEFVPDELRRSQPAWVRSLFVGPTEDWLVWQVSHRAAVRGVTGGVDLNVSNTGLVL